MEDEFLDKFGNCMNKEEEDKVCKNTCGSAGGKFIPRTGICKCNELKDEKDVCNRDCQKNRSKISVTKDGKILKIDANNTQTIVEPDDENGMKG